MRERSYLLEFVRLGNHVKVTACDPETGIETMIIGPANAPKKALSDLAVKKLEYVLKKGELPPYS
jgi:hypothetical protein